MRPHVKLILISALVALVLPNLYGLGCDGPILPTGPTITAPKQNSTVPSSGLFTASVNFPVPLTAISLVEMELQTDQGATRIDVTAQFLPSGQSDFAGAVSASADLNAAALGLVPGAQTFIVRLDADGVGGAVARAVPFMWLGDTACEIEAGSALSQCFLDASNATSLCYSNTGSACNPTDAALVAAEAQLRTSVTTACSDAGVQSLGYGTAVTADGLADRLIEECVGNAATLAARIFGGPHAKVRGAGVGVSCMDAAYDESAAFVDLAFNLQRDCVLDAGCNAATANAEVDTAASQAASVIDGACPGGFLEFLVGVPAAEAIARARKQSECMLGSAHGDVSPLVPTCSPGGIPGVTVVKTQPTGMTPFAPGIPTQVVLDEAVWGTRCGDGSPYAFWIQLATAGTSVGNVVSHMQGGGVCVTEGQCQGVLDNSPSLFSSLEDDFSPTGILNPDPLTNGFADWTKIFLPYCNQDVFTGGGVTRPFTNFSVERYGAVNARAALRVLRNIVANEMNDAVPTGFRPDLLKVVFSGTSAGGFGVMFNLHHVLDEERWVHSTMVNDAAFGLDSGSAFSVGGLGAIAQMEWATRLTQPPYCVGPECALGLVLTEAHSERLLGVPDQLLLFDSNQHDDTQVSTTAWPDTASFINAVRDMYCANNTLPGVYYWLDALPMNLHTYLTSDASYYTQDIAGVSLADWVEQGVFDPGNATNLAEEGTYADVPPPDPVYTGVLPFGCPTN